MITLTPPISYARPDNYFATKRTVRSIDVKIQDSSTCSSYTECFDGTLPVFANLAVPTDTLTNDFSSFMMQYGASTTVTATLTNKNTGVEYPITDNTYGRLFTSGEIGANNFGFRLDWYNVANLISFGKYEFKIELSNTVSTVVFFTKCELFQLIPFTCSNADDTVRITTYKNGYIENGNDYRNFTTGDWIDQIRLYGRFGLENHTAETDNLLLNNRDLHQIQTQIVDNFNLRISRIKGIDSIRFIKDDLLANKIKIDDYNRDSITSYKQKFVSLVSLDDPIRHRINGTYTYNIKLEEFNQSTLKRNF